MLYSAFTITGIVVRLIMCQELIFDMLEFS